MKLAQGRLHQDNTRNYKNVNWWLIEYIPSGTSLETASLKRSYGSTAPFICHGSIVQWLMVCVWVVALLVALMDVSSNLPAGSYFSWDWIGFYRIKGLDY